MLFITGKIIFVKGKIQTNNHLANNDKKILVISDSFGRPMCCYLGLYVRELVNLDIQDKRYEGSIRAYIDEYEPDVVIIMFNAGMYNYSNVFERLKG